MKNQVLLLLKENAGQFISGSFISSKLGISRAAVWKIVQNLQAEGFTIEAVTRRGYRLTHAPDRLVPGNILPLLAKEHAPHVICFPSISSTNDYAKTYSCPDLKKNYYFAAEEQTGGRGRRGRSFYSPPGTGLYLTGLYHPQIDPSAASIFTAYAAVAVCRAVEEVCGFSPDIKWPNDILWKGRKLCGILTEMALEGESRSIQYMISGIGVNVGQEEADFPEDIREIAGSLKMVAGKAPRRDALCAALINELEKAYEGFLKTDPSYRSFYESRCITLGKDIFIITAQEKTPAFAEALSDDFGLVARYEDGRCETVYAGEVSSRLQ